MNQLQVFNFEKNQVRIIVIGEEPYFVGKDVADVLGYSRSDNAIRSHVEEEDKLTHQISASGQNRNMTIINESGLYSLIFSSNLESAKSFKRWVTSEVLPSIRKRGIYSLEKQSPDKESFEMQLVGVDYATRILRVDETSKIKMLEEAHKEHHVPTNHLPSYVDDEVTKSLTSLLRDNGYGTSAAKINTKLIELGILEIKERPSSKGGKKEFKSLTDYGSRFGKNLINPKSPKETQPHYYESEFAQMMGLVQP